MNSPRLYDKKNDDSFPFLCNFRRFYRISGLHLPSIKIVLGIRSRLTLNSVDYLVYADGPIMVEVGWSFFSCKLVHCMIEGKHYKSFAPASPIITLERITSSEKPAKFLHSFFALLFICWWWVPAKPRNVEHHRCGVCRRRGRRTSGGVLLFD